MSADEDGLVRAILADPWDELARAAYADWLEEQGAARQALMMRQPEEVRWVPGELELEVSRGYPDDVTWVGCCHGLLCVQMRSTGVLSEKFQREGAAWLRKHRIALLSINGPAVEWPRVAASEALAGVRGILLRGVDVTDGVEAFTRTPALGGLAWLDLEQTRVTRAGLSAAVRPAELPALVRLGLRQTEVGAGLLRELGDGPLAGRLEHLDLTESQMGNRGVEALAACPALLGGLVTLRIGGSTLGDAAAAALLRPAPPARMRSLELVGGRLGDIGLTALAGSALLRRLHWLSLRGNIGGTWEGYVRLGRAVGEVGGLRLGVSQQLDPLVKVDLREVLGQRLIEG